MAEDEGLAVVVVMVKPTTIVARAWERLGRLITRRVALAEFVDTFTRRGDDVKVVVEMDGGNRVQD